MKSRRTKTTAWKRIRAGATALAVAFVGIGTAAHAVSTADSTPDPSRDGTATLTIHKKVGEGLTYGDNNGLELPAEQEPPNPLAGATFRLSRVETEPALDLTSKEGWATVSSISTEAGVNPSRDSLLDASAVTGLDDISTVTTGDDGLAKFDGLAFGLYYVEETETPEGFTPVAPFLVTLPMTHPEDESAWLYDVHVYPKDRYAPEKTSRDRDSAIGSHGVAWTITTSIPAGPVNSYRVEDNLDSRLTFIPGVKAGLNEGTGADATEKVSLKEGTDYEVLLLPDKDSSGKDSKRVVINFLPGGLQKISAEENKKLRPTFTFSTAVSAVGTIPNHAEVFENESRASRSAVSASAEAVTRWGMVKITKTDSADRNMLLAGAEFELYYSHKDDFATAKKTGLTSITNGKGLAQLGPIRYSDFADGVVTQRGSAGYMYYWLVETKAPNGYKKLSQPVPVQLRSDNTDEGDGVNVTIRNVATELPLTPGPGGNGGGGGNQGSVIPGIPGGLATTGAAGIVALLVASGIAIFLGAGMKRKGKNNSNA